MSSYGMYYYAGYGTHYLPLAKALERPERARSVDLGGYPPDATRTLKRLMRLDLRRQELPYWLGELRHLRMLSSASPTLTRVPDDVWALPKLREVYLETPNLADLDGLARSTSIRTVFFGRTPLGGDKAKVDAIVAANPGSKYSMGFLEIKRPPPPPPPGDKAALIRALNDDTLDDWADLSGVDLSGATFEDCLFLQSMKGANLRGTTFRRCDLSLVELEGADLSEAVFEDCYLDLSMRPAKAIVAPGIRFERCSLKLAWPEADLQGARFVELESSPRLAFEGADARAMQLAVVCYESSIDVSLRNADLRGATITFDIPASRRKELEAKPSAKVKWAECDTTGATTDDATSIVYTPLPEKKKATKAAKGKKAKAGFVLDDKGHPALALGRIDAPNASLWLLVIDGAAAAAWTGSDGPDFDRAMEVDEGPIDVGEGEGVITQIGDTGWSHVWRVAGGIALVCHYRSGHVAKMTKDEQLEALGRRVAQFPVSKTTKIGSIEITTGCVALLLPFASGTFSAAQLTEARSAPVKVDAERVLVPLPDGTYDVLSHDFAPERGYEDELGTYGACVRIVKAA